MFGQYGRAENKIMGVLTCTKCGQLLQTSSSHVCVDSKSPTNRYTIEYICQGKPQYISGRSYKRTLRCLTETMKGYGKIIPYENLPDDHPFRDPAHHYHTFVDEFEYEDELNMSTPTVKIPYDTSVATLEPTGLYTMPYAPTFKVAEVPREIYDTWTWADSNELMDLARRYDEHMRKVED